MKINKILFNLLTSIKNNKAGAVLSARVADQHHFNADLDPDLAFHSNAYPDPAFHFNEDTDPFQGL